MADVKKSRIEQLKDFLQTEIAALEGKTAAKRLRITQLRESISPQLAEINKLEDEIAAVESPQDAATLRDLRQELALLSRADKPVAHTLVAETVATKTEGQK